MHINTEFTKLIEFRSTKHPNNEYTQKLFSWLFWWHVLSTIDLNQRKMSISTSCTVFTAALQVGVKMNTTSTTRLWTIKSHEVCKSQLTNTMRSLLSGTDD